MEGWEQWAGYSTTTSVFALTDTFLSAGHGHLYQRHILNRIAERRGQLVRQCPGLGCGQCVPLEARHVSG